MPENHGAGLITGQVGHKAVIYLASSAVVYSPVGGHLLVGSNFKIAVVRSLVARHNVPFSISEVP